MGTPKLRTDKLLVSVYARHGDTCHTSERADVHDSLKCASNLFADDYVLVAKFAYLQEAIDYAREGARRGVSMRLVSRITPIAYVSNYIPEGRELPEEWRGEGAYTISPRGDTGRIPALASQMFSETLR